MPSFDSLIKGGVPDFGGMSGDVSKVATAFINGLQLVKSLSGKENSDFSGDKSYEELVNTVLGVSALITGSQKATETRRSAFEAGRTEDRQGRGHQGLDRPEHAAAGAVRPDAQRDDRRDERRGDIAAGGEPAPPDRHFQQQKSAAPMESDRILRLLPAWASSLR